MAVKLSSFTLHKRIPNWVSLIAHFSSVSCAINIQPITETNGNQSNLSEFEAKINFLKNKLHPDSLVYVLDYTPDVNSSLKLFKWASLQKRFNHTSDTYHQMILKLGMAGNVEEMEGFCSEMVREKFPGFEKSLLALIEAFVNSNRLSEALRVLYVMNSSSFKPSIEVFNELMGAVVEAKRDFKDVLFVYKEMVKAGILPNIETLNYLMEALFEAGKVDKVLDQYKRMHKKGCNPNSRTFEILITGLSARNLVDESIGILNEMFEFGCEPDSSFYSRIIPIFCRLQNLEIGTKLYKMMRASNIAPNSVSYVHMISCFCEHLLMDEAIKLYEEMISSDFLPEDQLHLNTHTYNTLLGFYCGSGNFQKAKDVFDEMFKRNITDICSWNIFIKFICENLMIKRASEYLCRMVVSSFVPDSTTYSALIFCNCKVGNTNHALDLFRQIRFRNWVLDSVSYSELIDTLCRLVKTQEATEVFCYMSSQDCALQSTYFSILIDKICENGEVKRAMKLLLLSRYTNTTSSSATYNSILRGLLKSGQINYIFVILSQMIIVGCAIDAETYCILIQTMASLNVARFSVSLFNLMVSKDLMPNSETLACLLSCMVKHSQMHLILSSIDKLVSKSDNILDSMMYNRLINSLWVEGYKSEASNLVDVMLEKGWVPDASTHALLMGSVARKETLIRSENVKVHDDKVCSILAEGLGEM